MRFLLLLTCAFGFVLSAQSQSYYYENFGPFDSSIPTPAAFLGYDIGEYHTRHDRIVAYMEALDAASDKASLIDYGKTHELRRLVILQISSSANIQNLNTLQARHMDIVNPAKSLDINAIQDLPVFVNLGYNVHGNEPSSSEAALLAAYVLVASNHPDITQYRENAVVFVDPTINPDGRDRHTQWANSYRGDPLVSDPMDAEHNEVWPRGRTNHYWFDLNRDWLLAVHPESQGKLAWYHEWYPNVVTDFHEMGTNSTYFFEPMKANGSHDPIMPVENYTTLNDTFANYYQREMDKIGSLYFTKEVFDGTYPGYGSSYPDIQGGLGILFEQASSRGHVQKTPMGDVTFPFTIRNQFVNSLATVEAAVEHKDLLHSYQHDFFASALTKSKNSNVKSYVFEETEDMGRLQAFLELLLRHKIEVYELEKSTAVGNHNFKIGTAYVVPTEQAQYRMVQTMFETYDRYADSVYYDASAWSLVNSYNMQYAASTKTLSTGKLVQMESLKLKVQAVQKSKYAYLIPWDEYYAPGFLYHLQSNDVNVMAAQKPFQLEGGSMEFASGTLVIPVKKQSISETELHQVLQAGSEQWNVEVQTVSTGFSAAGIDLGSRYVNAVEKPKVVMLIGDGTSGYEAGFVWHLMDQRVKMPITKLKTSMFSRASLSEYNTMVLVSGSYNNLDSTQIKRIRDWVAQGNTLITIAQASAWAIKNKIVKEKLIKKDATKDESQKDLATKRYPYIHAGEIKGKDAVGGTIFEVDLDLTHPIAFGYQKRELPVYRNNSVWLKPSSNEYSNVAMYSKDPHIDGFITKENLENYLKKSASIIVSKVGAGRAVMFAEDPNFRGAWYGTNKLFLNAVFFGNLVRVP